MDTAESKLLLHKINKLFIINTSAREVDSIETGPILHLEQCQLVLLPQMGKSVDITQRSIRCMS